MYALWIQCCEPCCILKNDDDFLSLLQTKIVEHITGKGMANTEAICRFVQSASSLEDLKLIVDAFVNNAYPALCKISWTIASVDLPEEHGHNGPAEVIPEPTFSEPVIEHEVLE